MKIFGFEGKALLVNKYIIIKFCQSLFGELYDRLERAKTIKNRKKDPATLNDFVKVC